MKLIKRLISVALAASMLLIGTSCVKYETGETQPSRASEGIGMHHAEIDVQNYGTIALELDGDTAPITVQNFIDLAQSGFYDGLTFHRIMDGFMIQGGDPSHNGTGGSSTQIKGEFESNGVKNELSHVRGTVSMARSQMPDSASSQFFIVQQDSTFLDGNYAAFGTVTSGMDIVDRIAKDANPTDDNGTIPFEEQPVIKSITIKKYFLGISSFAFQSLINSFKFLISLFDL